MRILRVSYPALCSSPTVILGRTAVTTLLGDKILLSLVRTSIVKSSFKFKFERPVGVDEAMRH